MTWRFRTILGFVLVPLLPTILLTPLSMMGAGGVAGGLLLGFYALLINAGIGYPVMLVTGLPLYVFCQWRRWTSFVFYGCAGAMLGGAIGFFGSLTVLTHNGQLDSGASLVTLALVAAGAVCGALTTSCFWLIVRPDHTLRVSAREGSAA